MASVVVITGGNSGVGYQIIKSLLKSDRQYKIYLGARSEAKAQSAIDTLKEETKYTGSKEVVPLVLDVDSDGSIAAAAEVLKGEGRVDVLINNAGVSLDPKTVPGQSSRKVFIDTLNTNLIGAHELTRSLAPLLLKSTDPRLIFISSDLGSLEIANWPQEKYFPNQPQPAGWENKQWQGTYPAYRASKAGLNILVKEWERWLKPDGVKVWSVNPGFVATNLAGLGPEVLRSMGAGDPETSGEFIKDIVEGKKDADAGKFISPSGELPF